MRKVVKVEILPTEEQKSLIDREINASRYVYNYFLMYRFNLYKTKGKNIKYNEEVEILEDLVNCEGWLKNFERPSLEQAIRELDNDLYNCFVNKYKYPKLKKKEDKIQWYKTKNENDSIKVYDKEQIIKLPFVGFLKTKTSDFLSDNVSYAKVIKTDDKYEVSLTFEIQ